MSRLIACFPLFSLLICCASCGGGGGGGSDNAAPGAPAGAVIDVQGHWALNLVSTVDDCPGGQLLAGDQMVMSIAQDEAAVSVTYPRLCRINEAEQGTASEDGFQAEFRRTIFCPGGGETTEISSSRFEGVDGDAVSDVTVTYEYGCPQSHCYRRWEGSGSRFSHDRSECGSPPPGASPGTPTPTPTPSSFSGGNLERCECSVAGCCSDHGGVHGCLADGLAVCNDDSISTCRCPVG